MDAAGGVQAWAHAARMPRHTRDGLAQETRRLQPQTWIGRTYTVSVKSEETRAPTGGAPGPAAAPGRSAGRGGPGAGGGAGRLSRCASPLESRPPLSAGRPTGAECGARRRRSERACERSSAPSVSREREREPGTVIPSQLRRPRATILAHVSSRIRPPNAANTFGATGYGSRSYTGDQYSGGRSFFPPFHLISRDCSTSRLSRSLSRRLLLRARAFDFRDSHPPAP